MASFVPPVATLASTSDDAPAACGTYTLDSEQGKSGGATYYCGTNRLYLYERSPQNWCVGKKAGGKSCKAYDSKGWHFYLEKQWTKRSDVTLTFGSESTSSTDVEAFAVECRYSNLAGGYKKTDRVECDRPVFRNEEKSKDLWLAPDGQWCFADAAGVDEEGDYDAFLESAEGENAASPEIADWADQHVHIHPVDIQAIEALHKSMEGDDSGYKDPDFVPGPAILDAAHGDSQWIRAAKLSGPDHEPQLWDGVEPSDIMQV